MNGLPGRLVPTAALLFFLAGCSHQSLTSIAPGPDDKNKIPGISVNGRAHTYVAEEKTNGSEQIYEKPKPAPPVPIVKMAPPVLHPLQREIYFLPNSTWIGPASKAVIQTWLQEIKDHHLTRVLLIGHTDPSGREALNRRLSLKRAATARWLLRKMGAKEVKIYLRAVGPLAKDGFKKCKKHHWKCYARNRAVRFIELGAPKKSSP